MQVKDQIKTWIEQACPQIKQKDAFVSMLKITENGNVITPTGYVVGRVRKGTFVPNPRASMDFNFDPYINDFI